jgi:hypothetical protein
MAVCQAGHPIAYRIAGKTAFLSNAAMTMFRVRALSRIGRGDSDPLPALSRPNGVRAELIRQITLRDRARPVSLTAVRKP